MPKLSTVFFGTPDFSVPSLEMLHKRPDIHLAAVVTMPDRPSGRGHQMKSPEVAMYAKAHKIPLIQTENINKDKKALELLEAIDPDLFVVLAFAQFLGQKLLNMPKKGCFNIHTSLLPKYRGAAPIQYALLNGDESTGVSIQKMVKKMDAGDLAWSAPIKLSPDETGGQLYTRLKFQAALSLGDFIDALKAGEIDFIKQDEAKVSFAPTLKKEDGLLDFKNETTKNIKNRIRALDPWPGTYCLLNKKRLKVFSVSASDERLSPGEARPVDGQILVGCSDGSLRLQDVQIEGKKRSSDTALLNGLKDSLNINTEL